MKQSIFAFHTEPIEFSGFDFYMKSEYIKNKLHGSHYTGKNWKTLD